MLNIHAYDTVALDDQDNALVIIDQTLLPNRIELIKLKKQQEIWQAIYQLKVRGAPAIGVAAGIGLYLAAKEIALKTEAKMDTEDFFQQLAKAKDYLSSARPTAVNLIWALNRVEACALMYKHKPIPEIIAHMKAEALQIRSEDIQMCRKIGEYGLSLLQKGQGILTHCNAGKLATVQYGTATAPIYLGQEQGYGFKVFVDETRPLLQGARLTALELMAAGVDVTLICDNMAAAVMQKGWVQAVFVGCDRVAANGDTANKIGTAGVAALAKHYGVPFYVCAPSSTLDPHTKTGADICIEERPPEEVTAQWYSQPMAPEVICVYNPAFDITDNQLISAIITEKGIARPPYEESLKFIGKEA